MRACTCASVSSAIARARSLPARRTARRWARSASSSRRRARTAPEALVHGLGDQPLQRRGAAGADARGDRLGRLVAAEGGQEHQVRDLGPTIGLVGDRALRVGPGGADQPGRLVLARADRDGVSAALAHLAAVHAEQQRRRPEQRLGLGEERRVGGVAGVEPPGDQPGELDVRQLVAADGHEGRAAEEDVGGLVHRVGEHERGHRRAAGRGHLLLDGRVASHLGDADEAQERHDQLVQGSDLAVGEDRRAVGIDADREVVGDEARPRRRAGRAGESRSVIVW